jgi:hypothetical protein
MYKSEDVSMNNLTRSNKMGWDGLAETHFKNYHVDRLLAGQPLLNELIRNEVGDVKGKSLVHLLCHSGAPMKANVPADWRAIYERRKEIENGISSSGVLQAAGI